jgi:tetratricopeptide (TPR) repeat protein
MKNWKGSLICARRFVFVLTTMFVLAAAVTAQNEDPAALRIRGKALIDAQKFTEALPVYETLVKAYPSDPEIARDLAFALLGQSANTEDPAVRRLLRIRSRETFVKAKDLGDDSLLVKGLIEGLPVDGADPSGFSDNAEANKAMQRAEALFTQGKLEAAFDEYQNALKLDPRCYHAALFSGDVKMQTQKYDEAEKWYQRVIAIDPYLETAYRYSATPLMKQGKINEARDRYIQAYITAPYNKLAVSGLVQWAQVTKAGLGHPRVDVPETKIGADGKQNTTININPLADDGSMAWIAYTATRDTWKKEKFAKTFPGERAYRHSLAEEADALRSVVEMAKTLKPKTLNSQIAVLAQLDKDGALESFILLARPDDDIANEQPAYLRANRAKLVQYVQKYVIQK